MSHHAGQGKAQDAITVNARKSGCQQALATGYTLLQFSGPLESDYRAFHAARALDVIRRMLPWVTLLYMAAVAVMFLGSLPGTFNVWFSNGLLPVLGALAWLWVARYTPLLAQAPHLHTAIVLAVSLFATTRTIFLLGNEPGAIYVTYQVIYLLFIAFTVAQLRVPQALGWTLAVAALLLLDAALENLAADWLAFGQYFAATTLISAVIGYLIEHRARGEWLKGEIAMHEQEEMRELKLAADAEAGRQRVLGDYLELVGGNLTATEIAGRTLKFLVQHCGAQIGTVYLVDGRHLRRASSHALEGESMAPDLLDRGESMIGQAAQDGRRLRLTHLPAHYHPIRTATGSAAPAELIVQPVQQQGVTLAVIELGSLAAFTDSTLALLDRISHAMATTLTAANARDALARAGMDEFVI
jgi:hypothetical protein